MNFYKSIIIKLMKVFSIALTIIIVAHISISLIIRNTMAYTNIVMYTLVCISSVVIVLLIILLKSSIKKTNEVYDTFLVQCDPKKALEIVNKNIEDSLTNNTKMAMTSIKVMIYFRLKMYKEAEELLKIKIETQTSNVTTIILWEHNKNMIYTALNNSNIEKYQEDFLNIIKRYPKKEYYIKAYHNAQIKYYYFVNYKYDGLDKYYEEELSYAATLIEKVSFSANLAKIYHYNKQIDKSKEMIKFVIENGNSMAAVDECKKLLEKIGENNEKNI